MQLIQLLMEYFRPGIVVGIFCDLTMAFDCVNHDILIEKIKYYGVNGTGIDWIKSCFHNRRQRVDIKVNNVQNYSSTWEIVKWGVPQGLVLEPLFFIIDINNLPRHSNCFTNVVLFADDTSILITEKNYENLNQKIRLTLYYTSRWFEANHLVFNLMKINIIKCSPLYFLLSQLITEHNNTTISEVPDTKFLGVQIDCHLNWKCHIDQILLKLSIVIFVIWQLFYVLKLKALWMAYFAYFHSVITYEIIFCGNATNSCRFSNCKKGNKNYVWSRTKSIL